jgi:regulator of sigma E protease
MIGLLNKTKGEPIVVTVDRAGSKLEFKVKPELSKEFGRYIIGISKSARPTDVPMVKRQYGPVDAVKNGFSECVNLISLTFVVIKKLFTAELSYKSLGGPIQIAQASAAAAKYGLAEFLYFMVFLSIQLGILNLMPIPILDGGQILFCLIEGVIRRPVPAKVRGVAQYIGLALLLTLFAFITVNDIDSVWGIKNIIGKFVK